MQGDKVYRGGPLEEGGWSCLWQDEQAGARRKECEDRGRQHNEGKGVGHGGSGGLWVASLILWLESRRASDGS